MKMRRQEELAFQMHEADFLVSHSFCMPSVFSVSILSVRGWIFTERLPTVVAPYEHRTLRLADIFTLIGFALSADFFGSVGGGMIGGCCCGKPCGDCCE